LNVEISADTGAKIAYVQVASKGLKVHAANGQALMVGKGVTGSLK
jgi:hypothetical protein